MTMTLPTLERHKSSLPVDLDAVARDSGAVIDWSAALPEEISGQIEPTDEGIYLISVNRNHSEYRKRFTAAHEIGHLLLHKRFIDEGVDDTIKYRSTDGGNFYNTNIEKRHEIQASSFAAELLMPREMLRRYCYANDCKPAMHPTIATKFGVSLSALRFRLKNLGIWNGEE